MQEQERRSPYLYRGSIYSPAGTAIDRPAVLIDHESDILIKYGNADDVEASFDRAMASPVLSKGLAMIELGSGMPGSPSSREQQCYILKRAVEYTASGFCRGLYEHALDGTLAEWIARKMSDMPIRLD